MRTIALLLVVLSLLCSMTGCRSTEQPAPLRVGTCPERVPFSYIDEHTGEVRGFDIDLITAITSDAGLGTEIEIRALDGDALLSALLNQEIDIIISALAITDERTRTVAFSDPYFIAGQAIAVRKDSGVVLVGDLAGRRIGVQTHTTGRQAVTWIEGVRETDIIEYRTLSELIRALQSGSVDALITDAPFLNHYLIDNPGSEIRMISPGFTIEFYGIAMRREDADLCRRINAALARLNESGAYEQIRAAWFDPPQ